MREVLFKYVYAGKTSSALDSLLQFSENHLKLSWQKKFNLPSKYIVKLIIFFFLIYFAACFHILHFHVPGSLQNI